MSLQQVEEYIHNKISNLNIPPNLETRLLLDVIGTENLQIYGIIKDGKALISEKKIEDPDVIVSSSEETVLNIFHKKLNPMMAFLTGKIKVNGKKEAIVVLKELIFKK